MSGAKMATHNGAEAMRTAVNPVGTSRSPKEIRRKGAAIASSPRSTPMAGRRRMSLSAVRASPPRARMIAYSTPAPSAVRTKTTMAGEKSSSTVT